MSLIHKINGTLLQTLNERAGGSSSTSVSTVSGMGSATIGNDTVSLSAGLSKGADLFAFSYKGLTIATDCFRQSLSKQQAIHDTVSELKTLAGEATSGQITDNERIAINKKFQSLLRDYDQQLQNTTIDGTDLLSITDLREILQDNGVDLSASSTLSEAFNKAGGKDFRLGKETVSIGDQTAVSVSNLSVDTGNSATTAYEALDKLEQSLNDDLKKTSTVYDELLGGLQFAIYGGVAFDDAANGLLSASGADSLATAIVNNIRANTHDSSLAAHSDIDSLLAKSLLAD